MSKVRIPIVFLPRKAGKRKGTITVKTSVGVVKIKVSGSGKPSIYDVSGFDDIVVMRGARVSRRLEVKNPTKKVFRIKEIFTTDSFLHLSLPQNLDDPDAPPVTDASQLWEIQPMSSREVVQVSFQPTESGFYPGFVHMKTVDNDFIIPFEVTVVDLPIIAEPQVLKFKLLTSDVMSASKEVVLRNVGSEPLTLTKASPSSADPSLEIDFQAGYVIEPFSRHTALNVTFHRGIDGRFEGEIYCKCSIQLKGTRKTFSVKVKYAARVLSGGVTHDENQLLFPVQAKPLWARIAESNIVLYRNRTLKRETRTIELRNEYQTPLKVITSSIVPVGSEESGHGEKNGEPETEFQLVECGPSSLVGAGATVECTVVLEPKTHRTFAEHLVLKTNVTKFVFPLLAFTSELELTPMPSHSGTVFSSKKLSMTSISSNSTRVSLAASTRGKDGQVDFGLIRSGESRELTFLVTNPNPIPIVVNRAKSTICFVSALFHSTPLTDEQRQRNTCKNPRSVSGHLHAVIGPRKSINFTILVSPTSSTRTYAGAVSITTSHSSLDIAVSFKFTRGQVLLELEGGVHSIPPLFPGMLLKRRLYATSKFPVDVQLFSLNANDTRTTSGLVLSTLEPNARRDIGYVSIDVARFLDQDNYLAGVLSPCRFSRMEEECSVGGTSQGLLDGVEEGSYASKEDIRALRAATSKWNQIVERGEDHLPLTVELQTDAVASLKMHLGLQLVFPRLFDSMESIEFPPLHKGSSQLLYCHVKNPSPWPVLVFPMLSPDDDSVSFRWEYYDNEYPVLVQPGETVNVGGVVFSPKSSGSFSGRLYLKNNLTRLESISVSGESGVGELTLESFGDTPVVLLTAGIDEVRDNRSPVYVADMDVGLDQFELPTQEGADWVRSCGVICEWFMSAVYPSYFEDTFKLLEQHVLSTDVEFSNSGIFHLVVNRILGGSASARGEDLDDICGDELDRIFGRFCDRLPLLVSPADDVVVRIDFQPDVSRKVTTLKLIVQSNEGPLVIAWIVRLSDEVVYIVSLARPSWAYRFSFLILAIGALMYVKMQMEAEKKLDESFVQKKTRSGKRNKANNPFQTREERFSKVDDDDDDGVDEEPQATENDESKSNVGAKRENGMPIVSSVSPQGGAKSKRKSKKKKKSKDTGTPGANTPAGGTPVSGSPVNGTPVSGTPRGSVTGAERSPVIAAGDTENESVRQSASLRDPSDDAKQEPDTSVVELASSLTGKADKNQEASEAEKKRRRKRSMSRKRSKSGARSESQSNTGTASDAKPTNKNKGRKDGSEVVANSKPSGNVGPKKEEDSKSKPQSKGERRTSVDDVTDGKGSPGSASSRSRSKSRRQSRSSSRSDKNGDKGKEKSEMLPSSRNPNAKPSPAQASRRLSIGKTAASSRQGSTSTSVVMVEGEKEKRKRNDSGSRRDAQGTRQGSKTTPVRRSKSAGRALIKEKRKSSVNAHRVAVLKQNGSGDRPSRRDHHEPPVLDRPHTHEPDFILPGPDIASVNPGVPSGHGLWGASPLNSSIYDEVKVDGQVQQQRPNAPPGLEVNPEANFIRPQWQQRRPQSVSNTNRVEHGASPPPPPQGFHQDPHAPSFSSNNLAPVPSPSPPQGSGLPYSTSFFSFLGDSDEPILTDYSLSVQAPTEDVNWGMYHYPFSNHYVPTESATPPPGFSSSYLGSNSQPASHGSSPLADRDHNNNNNNSNNNNTDINGTQQQHHHQHLHHQHHQQ